MGSTAMGAFGRPARVVAAVLGAVLAGSLLAVPPALAAPAAGKAPAGQADTPGRWGGEVTGTAPERPAVPSVNWPDPVWPTAASARAVLRPTGQVKAGSTPVSVARVAGDAGRNLPTDLTVEVVDRARVPSQWRDGVVLRVGGATGTTASGTASVSVDYSGFRHAYGGSWASRLRLWQLPQCALTTPDQARCSARQLPTENDTATGTVTADAEITPIGGTGAATTRAELAGDAAVTATAGTLFAVTAAASGPSGDFAATSLSPSSTWSAGGSSGSFNWSYGLGTPPVHAGSSPSLAVSYSSGGVDGRSNATNNQPSWIGEGFDLGVGYIERRYVSCADDTDGSPNNTKTTRTGDLCWRSDNAVMSLNGSATELIWEKDKGWHGRSEDGSKIEKVNAGTGTEHWKVTATNGTEYYFGRQSLPGHTATTESALKVPVYGNHANEPCHAAAFADSVCDQTYRWNLDYIVDVRGNTQSFWYEKEVNYFGTRATATAKRKYDRGGVLKRVDYGTWDRGAADRSTTALAQVVFDTGDRCVTTSCGTHNGTNWPDTPWDRECTQAATECADKFSPTFWTTKRLTKVTTRVWDTTKTTAGWQDVTSWALSHSFPSPGDGGDPGLWLDSIVKTGLVGGSISLPAITFHPVPLENRVLTMSNTTNSWQRLSKVISESGATTHVTYTQRECSSTNLPASPVANDKRCYPVIGPDPQNPDKDITEYWHKYLVESVTETDIQLSNGAQSAPMVTTYTYEGKPAWHYADDDGLSKPKYKTWNQFRGYQSVATRIGAGAAKTLSRTTYLRGMHGDRASVSGGTRTVTVGASLGDETVYDEDAFSGMVRETVLYNGVDTLPVSKTVNVPWQSQPTATRTINGDRAEARYTRTQTTYTATAVGKDGARGWRSGRTHSEFEQSYGAVVSQQSDGDLAVVGDESCVTYTYNHNTTKHLLGLPKRATATALTCDKAPAAPDDVVSDTRTYYDGATSVDTAPAYGSVTKSETLKDWTATGGTVWETAGSTTYDVFGRAKTVTDVKGGVTKTDYTPASGGPVTKVTTTNQLGWETSIAFAPYWGLPTITTDPNKRVTTRQFDALGRLARAWDAGLNTANNPTVRYTYAYSADRKAYPYVKTETLHAAGGYNTSYTILDGFLRTRQSQSAALDGTGNRVVTDVQYDEFGYATVSYQPHLEIGAPSGTFFYRPEWSVPSVTKTTHDLAGRTTETALWASNGVDNLVKRWGTTFRNEGDRTLTTPPRGATPTTVSTDFQGRTTELRLHNTATGVDGPYLATTYTYNGKGKLTKVTDPNSNEWTYRYDVKGREITRKDPDAGTSTIGYNAYGEVETTTNGAGESLYHGYDALGRPTALRDDSASGALRAEWKYDALWTTQIMKGQLTESIRYDGGAAYKWQATAFDIRYNVTSAQYVIPSVEGTGLAGTWTVGADYSAHDGTQTSVKYQSAGGLAAETATTEFHASNGLPNALKSSMPSVGSYVINQQYTAFGEPVSSRRAMNTGGFVENRTYYDTATRRVTGTTIQPVKVGQTVETAPTVSDTSYTYDHAGNILGIADDPGSGSAENQCFEYDVLQRMTSAWTPKDGVPCDVAPSVANLGGPAPYWTDWTIDNIGNRTKEVSHAAAGDTTTTYTVPASGPNSVRPHSVTSATTTSTVSAAVTRSFTHDGAGNTLTRQGKTAAQTLTWDAEGRTTKTTEGGTSYTNVYDANGNRLIRRDPTGTTLYLPGMEVRRAASNGAISAVRYYSFVDGTIASRTGTAVDSLSWLYDDHQGTQSITVNSVGLGATVRRQTPYGGQRGTAVSWPNEKGFVGGDNDPTGLTHIGAREYDPSLGRFISVDPVMDLADPQQWNAYSYAYNSPVTNSDPTGLRPECGNGSANNDTTYSCSNAAPNANDEGPDWPETGQVAGPNWSISKGNGIYFPPPGEMTLARWLFHQNRKLDSYRSWEREAVVEAWLCYNFPDECIQWRKEKSDRNWEELKEITGIADFEGCAQGNWVDCAWAASNFIPWGKVAGKGLKIAGGAAADALKGADEVATAAKGGDEAADAGRGADDLLSCPLSGKKSFSGDTLVLMADGGTKKIADIVVGDEVLASDPETGERGARTVTHIWPHYDDLITLQVAGSVIRTTEDHPYWNLTDRQWQRADELDVGDMLSSASGLPVVVESIGPWQAFGAAAYNLTVDGLHTYYVLAGKTPVLVHNTGGASSPGKGAAGTQMLINDLVKRGYVIRGTEISMTAANGVNVRFDVVAEKNGALSVYDAKNGPTAGFTKNQGSLGGYMSVETHGGTFYGPNAQKAGLAGIALGPTRVNIAGFGGYPHC